MPSSFKYEIAEEFDHTIDEKGNAFIALRKIKWGNNTESKLDLRKYYTKEDGEVMSKGVSFITEDGPNELTRVLLETGYGEPNEIVKTIKENRKDILNSLVSYIENGFESEDNSDDYYDPRELIV